MPLNEPIVEATALEWFRLRQGCGGQVGEPGDAVGRGPGAWGGLDQMGVRAEK